MHLSFSCLESEGRKKSTDFNLLCSFFAPTRPESPAWPREVSGPGHSFERFREVGKKLLKSPVTVKNPKADGLPWHSCVSSTYNGTGELRRGGRARIRLAASLRPGVKAASPCPGGETAENAACWWENSRARREL